MRLVCFVFILSCLIFEGFADIRAIIFDCDGTLVDSEEMQYFGWKYAFEQQGYILEREQYLDIMNKYVLSGNPSAQSIFVKLGAELIGKECQQELLKDMHFYGKKLHDKGFPAIIPTVEFLHRVAQDKERLGLKIGLASGAPKDIILGHLRFLGVEEYFDVILSGSEDLQDYVDEQGTNKPKPYIYMHAAKLLEIAPEQCVAIEDSSAGVTAAVDAGCIAIAIPNTYTMQHDLSHAHIKLVSLQDMSPEAFLEMIQEECP